MENQNEEKKSNSVLFAEKENRIRSKGAVLDSYFIILNTGMECYTKYIETGTISTNQKVEWIKACRSLLEQSRRDSPEFYKKYSDKTKLNEILSDIDLLYDFSLKLTDLDFVYRMREVSREEQDAIEQYRSSAYK